MCKKKTPIKNMRYDKDGKSLLCMDCANRFTDKTKQTTPPKSAETKKAKTELSELKIQYQCERCKYKFSRKKSWSENRCPYCGNIQIRQIENATRILQSSVDRKYDL
jgi:hypothetical protein